MTNASMLLCVLVFAACLAFPFAVRAQSPEIKFIADTLVIQADGRYQTEPDLAREGQIFLRKWGDHAAYPRFCEARSDSGRFGGRWHHGFSVVDLFALG